jgi:hypothetical protein
MAAIVYNVAKANIDISDLRVMLMVGHTPNQDHATLAAVIAGSGAEATFTNYVRKALASEAHTIDQSGNLAKLDATDPVWTAAGGAVNELVSHEIVYQYAAADADAIPVSCHDVGITTNGGDLTIAFHTDGILTTA